MMHEPRPCAAGCGAVIFGDEDTCSLPCTVEVQRRRSERMLSRVERQRQVISSSLIELPRKVQVPKKAPKKRVRRR